MITLKNDQDVVREAPTGFSWTILFFGAFVPLLRGDIKGLFIQFMLTILTCGLSVLVFPFVYNKMWIKTLYREGYKPTNEDAERYFIDKQIIPIQS